MQVHLIDGTYELFRHFYAVPRARDAEGREVGAVRGVLASLLSMLKSGTTHIAVATDHVIESFRNSLWAGYKTGEGIDPDLPAQLPLLDMRAPMDSLPKLRITQEEEGPFPSIPPTLPKFCRNALSPCIAPHPVPS